MGLYSVIFLICVILAAIGCCGHAYYITVMSVKTSNDLGSETSITEFSSEGFELLLFNNDSGGTQFEVPDWAKSEGEKQQGAAMSKAAAEEAKKKASYSGRWLCANCGSWNPGSIYVCTCGNMKSSNSVSGGKDDSMSYYEEVKLL